MGLLCDIFILWGLGIDAWITIITVVAVVAVMLMTKVRADAVMLIAIGVLFATGVLDAKEMCSGFSAGTVVVTGVLAAARRGKRIEAPPREVPLQAGDTLLFESPRKTNIFTGNLASMLQFSDCCQRLVRHTYCSIAQHVGLWSWRVSLHRLYAHWYSSDHYHHHYWCHGCGLGISACKTIMSIE